MIEISLQFNEKDAARLFESNGIKVVDQPIPNLFGIEKTVKKVVNPTNGYHIPLEKAFTAVMDQRVRKLLINDIDKLTIYNTLNTLK